MKTQLLLLVLAVGIIRSVTAQNETARRFNHWQGAIEMGVLGGRVQPDAPTYPYYGGGWYYPNPYATLRPTGNRIGLTIHTFVGYKQSARLVTGVATGVDYYNNTALFPVAAALRGDLLWSNRRITPFYALEGGYAFRGPNPHDRQLKGGWLWSPGLGLRINKGNGTGFLVSAGYRHQQARQVADVDGTYTLSQVEYRRYNRLYFRLGFSF